MPDTVMAHVNKLAWNEQNQFIFTDHSGHTIGEINIKGVDRYDDDRNKNQSLQDTHLYF